MESEEKKFNKIENKLLNDDEFISKTKKGIYLTRVGKFIESERIFKELISKSKESKKIDTNIESNSNYKDKSTKKMIANEEVVSLEKNEEVSLDTHDETELSENINNARKTRRRSSASIE